MQTLNISLWMNIFNLHIQPCLKTRAVVVPTTTTISLRQSQLPHLFSINKGFTPSNLFPHSPTSVIHTTRTFTSAGWRVFLLICLHNSGVTTGQLRSVTWCTPTRENRAETKEPPSESLAFQTSPHHPSFLHHTPSPPGPLAYSIPSISCSPTQSVGVITAVHHSLNRGTPQRPRSHYDSLSTFDFSSHLRSINSAMCCILYLNCSSSIALGKGRRAGLEKLRRWLTGEIERENKLKTNWGEERETTEQHPLLFYCCLCYIGRKEAVECRKWKVSSVIVALSEPNWRTFISSPFPRFALGLFCVSLLPDSPSCPSNNPFLCFFFLSVLSLVVRIDRVTCQKQGSQFYITRYPLYVADG